MKNIMNKKKKIIITGSAGFIGHALSTKLLQRGDYVFGIDNHDNYYDPKLKEARVKNLKKYKNYKHFKIDISNKKLLEKIFKKNIPQLVINLAAQAGVRYSIENPYAYIKTNIVGFSNILENCRNYKIKHLVYASSSSIYGANTNMPFLENDSSNHPLSVYAASKKSNELMAHAYSHLFNIPSTALRFFTVYGPWGRPDMALFRFTKSILEGKTIKVFNYGKHTRDFTYIDDIVNGIIKILEKPATVNKKWKSKKPDPASSKAPWRVYNIGNSKPIELMDYINTLSKILNKKPKIIFLPLQKGDVPDTFASTYNLKKKFGYKPATTVKEGLLNFVQWYRKYYNK